MRKTTNYNLTLYDKDDKMSITSVENSLNANMEIIDSKLKEKANIENIPTKTSQLTNDSSYTTETYVKNEIANAQLGGGEVDLSGYATKEEIPTKTSQLTNDSGYLTVHQDITHLATKAELHTHSNKTVLDNITQSDLNNWNSKSNFSGSYNDLTNKPTIPTKTSELTNDSSYVNENYVTNAINNAIGAALGGSY